MKTNENVYSQVQEDQIVKIAYKNTMRVLKENSLYSYIVYALDKLNWHYLVKRSRNKVLISNPFAACKSMSDIYNSIKTLTPPLSSMASSQGQTKGAQRKVLEVVNCLIHYCIEPFNKDMKLLDTLSHDAFDFSCKSLFGDDYCDLMKDEKNVSLDENGIEDIVHFNEITGFIKSRSFNPFASISPSVFRGPIYNYPYETREIHFDDDEENNDEIGFDDFPF